MKQKKDKRGYRRVTFTTNYKRKTFLVHRLVASAFIPNPKNKPYVNHINEVTNDNRVENLEWCTNSENLLHNNVQKITHRKKLGKKVAKCLENGKILEKFCCINEVKEKENYSPSYVSIAARNNIKAYGYYWKFI